MPITGILCDESTAELEGYLELGKYYRPYGTCAAIGILGGERYYWFVDGHGTVSMMPARSVE